MCKSKIFAQFKIFNDIDETQIHNYYFFTKRNCNEICSDDLKTAKKDNQFKHKWLFDPNTAKCDKTNKWCLVYIDGKGMFCSLCRNYDIKQNNGQKTWNAIANVRCRTQTVIGHFKKETSMHQEAVRASIRQKTSYFDLEEKKKVTALKNDLCYKVFCSCIGLLRKKCHHRKLHLC